MKGQRVREALRLMVTITEYLMVEWMQHRSEISEMGNKIWWLYEEVSRDQEIVGRHE